MEDVSSRRLVLAAIDRRQLSTILERVTDGPVRGRPWSRSLRDRIVITCVALRTNLTMRELGALFEISKSTAHRIVARGVAQLATGTTTAWRDRRESWVVDGTLVPTRDHCYAAKSKNYRWSCNAQILVRRTDLLVLCTVAGGPGNRNDPIHYRGSAVEELCRYHGRVLADGGYRGVQELVTPVFRKNRIVRDRIWRRHRRRRARVEHAIARLKDWRVLRDHRRRGQQLAVTIRAVAFLHNLRLKLRDNS